MDNNKDKLINLLDYINFKLSFVRSSSGSELMSANMQLIEEVRQKIYEVKEELNSNNI